MKIKKLLDKANKGYPDGALSEYYDRNGEFREGRGDELAQFIVGELIESIDPDATDTKQIEEAVQLMKRARDDIQRVINALEE